MTDPERQLRVLYVSHTPLQGGAALSLLGLLRGLPDSIKGILAAPEGKCERQIPDRTVKILIPGFSPRWSLRPDILLCNLINFYHFGKAIQKAARLFRVDIIHANNWPGGLAVAMFTTGFPVVCHVRDLNLRPVVIAKLGKLCKRNKIRLIAISKAVAIQFYKFNLDENQLTVVYNGIASEDLQPQKSASEFKKEFGLKPDAPLVCSIGWLVPWKQHELVLEVAKRVHEVLPQVQFLIAGDNPPGLSERKMELEALINDMDLQGIVFLPGHVDDVASLLNASDLLLHTAEQEAFGRVVLEAMLAGKPVAAVDSGGVLELVVNEVTGLLVNSEPDELARQVIRLLGNTELAQKLGAAGRERAEKEFSVEQMVQGTVQVYEQVLDINNRLKKGFS